MNPIITLTIFISVRISGSEPYQGLFLQARKKDGSGPVGTWVKPDSNTGTRLMSCQSSSNTVTHSSTSSKSTLDFTWNPPNFDEGDIIFR